MRHKSSDKPQAISFRQERCVALDHIAFVGRIKPKALSAITAKSADNAARYSPYVEIAA